MKNVGIIGAGFTGLSAAFFLQQKGYKVTIFEKETFPGGLATGFKKNAWNYSLESHYHHFFTNDKDGINLMKHVGEKYLTRAPATAIYRDGKIARFDSPISLLTFPLLNLLDKIRVGIILLFLKISPIPLISPISLFEKQTASQFLTKFMGRHAYEVLFKPLLFGKFGDFDEQISAVWFWARIKKRTPHLIYPVGGYQNFAGKLADKIRTAEGKILLNALIEKIEKTNSQWRVKTKDGEFFFDKIILTSPSSFLPFLLPSVSLTLLSHFLSIRHLASLNLILETKKPVLEKTYWLNINEDSFPFLAVVQHTNFIDKKNYGNHHLCYIGNYLPENHEYLHLSKEKLIDLFLPFIQKINPKFKKEDVINSYIFMSRDAQPIMEVGYKKLLPPMNLAELDPNLEGLYLTNMDMVYPWDRGVNYAIEMGKKVAATMSNK
jgi:protoporphyrinogen oxidase